MLDQPLSAVAVISYLSVVFFATNGVVMAFSNGVSTTLPGRIRTCLQASSDYEKLDGEKRINLRVDLDQAKVASMEDVAAGKKKAYCRCWASGTFPLCDGTHVKHNAATGDNIGPLIVSVPKSETKSDSVPSSTESLVEKKIEGRKKRVLLGYRATAVVYVLFCQRYFSTKGIQPFAVQVTSGYVLAAGLAYILSSAAKGGRLSSDTYKRLNLALIEFGMIGVLGWGLVKFGKVVPGFSPILVPPLLATIQGIKGYGYGVLGLDKSRSVSLLSDFGHGVVSTLKGYVAVPKNIKAAGYLAATWMVTGMKLAKLVEVIRLVVGGANGLTVFTRLSRFARYAMLSTVLYTLKDAADRGRLEGTTFVELNFLTAGVLAAMASYYASIGSTLGGAAAVFSVFSAFNGIASIVKKRQS